jgi:hypothetical protein
MRSRGIAGTGICLLALALGATIYGGGKSKTASKSSVDKTAAEAVFERLKKLEGKWREVSTKGWAEETQIHTLARGTAVSVQAADPKSEMAMLTVYHLDGGRLLLTHYCEAGNQPRLAATSIEDEGQKVTFTFLDGTNMTSRNVGHMDKVVMVFEDDHHFSEQWTWYQDGKEK